MPRRQNSASSSRPPSSSSSRPFSRGIDVGSDENHDQIGGGEDALRSQGYSLQEIVNDRSFPLDSNLLHTIISSLMHCVPRECIVLPEFRLEELFSTVSRGQFIMLSEGKLTESFITFSVLCLYTTLSADVPESFLLNWMLLLQNIICESLVIVQNMPLSAVVLGKTDAQQAQSQLSQRAVCAPLPDVCHHDPHLAPFGGDLFDAFHDCVFYMRLLLKESFQFHNQLQQLQEISSPKDFKANFPNKLPDSMKAVHIYMMSVASFAHCTLTLSTLDAANTQLGENSDMKMKNKITYGDMITSGVNGLTQRLAFVVETLLLALMTTTVSLKELWHSSDRSSLQSETRPHTKTSMSPSLTVMIQQFLHSLQNKNIDRTRNDTSGTTANSQTTNHSRHHFFRTVSFDASILLAQRVSQVLLHIICDNNTIQVVTTGKKRFLKNVSHPEMPLLLFKIQSLSQSLQPEKQSKTMLQKSTTVDSKKKVENLQSNVLSFVQVLPATDESFHIFNQMDIPLLNALFQLEEEEKRKLEAELLMDEMKVRLDDNNQIFKSHQTLKDVTTHEQTKDKSLLQGTNKRNQCEDSIEREKRVCANNNNLVKAFVMNRKKEDIHDSLQIQESSKVQPSLNLKRSSTTRSIEQHKAAISKSQFEKKLNHFNMLKKSFRELFLVFDCLSVFPTTISERQDSVGGNRSFVHPFLFVSPKNFGTDFNSMLDECVSSIETCDGNKCTSQYIDINRATQEWRCSVFSPDYQPSLLQNPFQNMNQQSLPTKQKCKNDGSINENDHVSINNSVTSKVSFVSKRSLTEQVRHFEALCLHMYQPVVCNDHHDKVYVSYRSRLADPLQSVCHATQCVLDYLWHLCREDRGICRTRDQQITLLNKQLSKPVSKNRKVSLGSSASNSVVLDGSNDKSSNFYNEKHSKRQLSTSLPFMEKNAQKNRISSKTHTPNVVSLPFISPIDKKPTSNSLDLAQRLSQAKQCAHLEAKLHSLQNDTHKAANTSLWEVLQEQYFSKSSSKNAHDGKEFNFNDEESEIDESEAFKAKYSQDLSSSNSESDSETDEFNTVSSPNQARRSAVIGNNGDNNTSHFMWKKKSIVWFYSESHNYNVDTFKHKQVSSHDTNSQNPRQTKGSKAINKRDTDTPSDPDLSERQGDVIKNMIQQHILHAQQQSLQNNGDDGTYYQAPDHPLRGLPLPASLSQVYATHLEQKKHQEREILSQKENELNELQAKLVAENKVFRQRALQLQRQQQLEELQATQAVQQEYDTRRVEWKRKQLAIEEQMKEAQRLKEENEKIRINDIQNLKRFQEMKKENERNEEMQLQSLMISFVTNAKEHEENMKRLREEENMRNEEAKRFIIEQKQELKRQTLAREQEAKKEKIIQAIARSDHRLRRGNFVWHNGRFGFYDNVRSEEKIPAYIQYTDEHNLYYDPLTKSFLRRKPLDADVTTYTDEARNQYDAIYGVGAYDAYHADIAFKLSVNEHGGYYDNETGEWQVAYGYFDPEKDYEWVPYEGYYDETTGKFIKYAKVQGDLSFMV